MFGLLLETIYFLTQFVILNEVKNLNAFTLCIQILRDAQDDNWVLTDISFPIIIPRKGVNIEILSDIC